MAWPRVVVTGLGAVSPHGRGVDALWRGLLEGRTAFRRITLFDVTPFRNPLAGEVEGYPAQPDLPPRAVRMLRDACAEALAGALGLAPAAATPEIAAALAAQAGLRGAALVSGTNFGGMSAAERALAPSEGAAEPAALSDYLFGSATARLAGEFGLGGPRVDLSLSCASGVAALGQAFDLIRLGRVPAALACGYDELSLFVYAGLSALHAITPEMIRPFDVRRKGTLFAEGAGALVLESLEHARARGARIQAEVLGRALNNDAYHMTAPEQAAHGIQALMRGALADAACAPEEIDLLNLHATGTPYNDALETKAVHAVFGPRGETIPVSAVKGSIGHTMGAAGALESLAAILSLREGLAPPVPGLDPAQQDPACNLRVPTGAPLAGSYRTVLKTSYGFGGTNAAVVLRRV